MVAASDPEQAALGKTPKRRRPPDTSRAAPAIKEEMKPKTSRNWSRLTNRTTLKPP